MAKPKKTTRHSEKNATAQITKRVVARKKKVLQLRGKDTIVYVRMKPPMYDVFEAAYAAYCEDNMLNPSSYGMSTFVRENAFAHLKSLGAV